MNVGDRIAYKGEFGVVKAVLGSYRRILLESGETLYRAVDEIIPLFQGLDYFD